jgi:flavin reductase (DIM6/NTAB) family NADH-FMN oxidoreductase RutF
VDQVDGASLRAALRHHPAGVTIVTAPGPVGFTATSFTPVSLDPPLVAFFLDLAGSARPTIETVTHFGVHLLGSDHAHLAQSFARKGVDRFADVGWSSGADDVPLLDGVPAWLRCAVTLRQVVGDHLLVVGRVLEASEEPPGEPGSGLIHHGGRIVALAAEDPLAG